MPDGAQWIKRSVSKQTLRPHQITAIEKVTQCLSEERRATLVMACATGKTLVSIHSAYQLLPKDGGIIVVLCPSLGLIWQTEKQWREQWPGAAYRLLAVCSDKRGKDEIRPDGSELDYGVTTRPDDVKLFLEQHRRGDTSVVFVTYHSAPIVGSALVSAGRSASFAIFDEAHRTAGGVDKAFGYALKDERFPADRRLFMTATPRIAKRWQKRSAKSEGDEFPVVSMDDEAVYGSVPFRYTFRQAIDDKVICPYQILISVVKKSELRGGMPEEDEAALIALNKAMAKTGAKKVISFHASIEAAQTFANDAKAYLDEVKAIHINGNQSGVERRQNAQAFGRATRAVATNMKCLTEGIDVPDVDMVAFMARKDSQIDIVQAVGRSQRNHSGKKFGYVLLPLLLDVEGGETVEDAVERKKLDTIWRVVSAMMDDDLEFTNSVRERARKKGAEALYATPVGAGGNDEGVTGQTLMTPQSPVDGQQNHEVWPVEVISEPNGWKALQAAINVSIVDKVSDSWDEYFGLLEAYVTRTGTACVPQRHKEGGRRLGYWVGTQRQNMRAGALSEERVTRLQSLPGWAWNAQDHGFERNISLLLNYVARTGSALVPHRHLEAGEPLGKWVVNQRAVWRRGEIEEGHAERLQSVPGWTWSVFDESWQRMFGILQSYVAEHGTADVPAKYKRKSIPLGNWVHNQRFYWRKGILDASRAAKLESLPGWRWNELWEKEFALLEDYLNRTGGSYPTRTPKDPEARRIAGWLRGQRDLWANGSLLPQRAKRLEALPNWSWSAAGAHWERYFSCVQRYAARTGNIHPLNSHREDGMDIRKWVRVQRIQRDKGLLSQERIAKLETLPGWSWNVGKKPGRGS